MLKYILHLEFFVDSLTELKLSFQTNMAAWKDFYDSASPQLINMPPPFAQVQDLLWMCILRCVRPDKIVAATQV